METKPKAIYTPYVARRLLKMGETIVDIKPNKDDPARTVFIFKVSDTFYKNMAEAVKHE